jgi:hypothetical protein
MAAASWRTGAAGAVGYRRPFANLHPQPATANMAKMINSNIRKFMGSVPLSIYENNV